MSMRCRVVETAGLLLALSACSNFNAPAPSRTGARSTPAAPVSTVSATLTIPLTQIASILNAKTERSIADVSGRPVKCGIGNCKLNLRAVRTGPIDVAEADGALGLHLPFEVEAQMAAPGFLSMLRASANGSGEADATTRIGIAPDWRLRSSTQGTVHVENSHLRIGPIVTNLADVLNDNQELLSRPLWRLADKQLANLRLEPEVQKAWQKLAQPIRVGKKPISWLVLHPVRVRVAAPMVRAGQLILSLGLEVRGDVVTAETPPANAAGPLPPAAPMQQASDRFVVSVPAMLPYDEAARLAMASLTKRPPRIAGNTVRFTSLAVLPSGDDVVLEARFCIDPGWDFTGWFSSCGTGYLRGAPHFDPARGTISITGVHYDLETADLVLRTMRALAGDQLGRALQSHLVFDVSREIARLHDSVRRALAKPQGRDVTISATIDSFGPPSLIWTKDGFVVLFQATGKVLTELRLGR
jgi:hypothetical protein